MDGSLDYLRGRDLNQTREAHKPAKPTTSWDAPRTKIQLDGPLRTGVGLGCVCGCAKARLGPKGRSETCPSGSSFFLAACVFSDDSELVLEKTALQMPSGYLRFLLSFSLSSLAALFSHSRSAP